MSHYEQTPPRYELKLPLQGIDSTTVLSWVRLHPAHWRESYPQRQINNIYFDAFNLRALRDNLDGVAERAKLRLRWYGRDLESIKKPNLELKRREGNVGWKEMIQLDTAYDLDAQVSWTEFYSTLSVDLPLLAKRWTTIYPQVVLLSYYRRRYYETMDGEIRLTIDTDLHTYPQGSARRPDITRIVPIEHSRVVVVEVKAAPEHAARLSDIVAALPVTSHRFSKYVQGLSAAWGLTSELFA